MSCQKKQNREILNSSRGFYFTTCSRQRCREHFFYYSNNSPMNTEIYSRICQKVNEADYLRRVTTKSKDQTAWYIEVLFNSIEKVTGYTRSDLESKSRLQDIVFARFLFCQIAHQQLGLTKLNIGKLLKRDHSTVIHALKECEMLQQSNYCNYKTKYDRCLSLFKLAINRS